MVNLYHYRFTIVYTDPTNNQEHDVNIHMKISKRKMDKFTAETISYDFVGRHLFSQYLFNLLPNDRKNATVLTFNRNSDELEIMKQKLHEYDICKYQILC